MGKLPMKVRPMIEALTHKQMLDKIGGGDSVKLTAKDWTVRRALNWHTKAKSAVRHLLAGEQKFSPEEQRDVEAGFLRFCADEIRRHHEEDQRLIATLQSSLEYLSKIDPEFHQPAIQALRSMADRIGHVAGGPRQEARGDGEG